jgi:hypothetical protein
MGRRRPGLEASMNDEDYVSQGKTSNAKALESDADEALFRMAQEDELFESVLDVPFALKHLRDLHAVMRHSVAVLGDRHEALAHDRLFHLAFSAFTLGFALGLVEAHRKKMMALRPGMAALTRGTRAEAWGVEIATYYIAYVDLVGVFGKRADIDLYGIGDEWREVANEERVDAADRLEDVVAAGRRAARAWFEEESADVPAVFIDALTAFIGAPAPDRAR